MARTVKNFTVCLHEQEAQAVTELLSIFGGTVGGFCTSIVRDYINLTPEQILIVRRQIRTLAKENISHGSALVSFEKKAAG